MKATHSQFTRLIDFNKNVAVTSQNRLEIVEPHGIRLQTVCFNQSAQLHLQVAGVMVIASHLHKNKTK